MTNGEWLTYAQAAERLGLTIATIKGRMRRQKWPRRTPNAPNAPTMILVPAELLEMHAPRADPVREPGADPVQNGIDHDPSALFEALLEQLAAERKRAVDAEQKIAALEAAETDRKQWRLRRRLRWALRRD